MYFYKNLSDPPKNENGQIMVLLMEKWRNDPREMKMISREVIAKGTISRDSLKSNPRSVIIIRAINLQSELKGKR